MTNVVPRHPVVLR